MDRPVHDDDLPFEPCSDDEEIENDIPKFEVADLSEPQPLDIIEFVDQIDSR